MSSKPTFHIFKGHPTITLNPDDKFPFSFGLKKAELIVEHIEAIKTFIKTFPPQKIVDKTTETIT